MAAVVPLVAEPRVLRTGTVALAGAVVLSLALSPLGEPWRTGVAGVVAVLLVALGSPHGALDHLVLLADRDGGPGGPDRRNSAWRSGWRSAFRGLRASFVVPYVALALVALGGYLVDPRTGFALFLALSVAHFAAGEAGVAVDRGLARSWRDPLAWAAALGGAVVVVLPLASREAGTALAAVDPRLAPVLQPLPPLAAALTVVVALTLVACAVAAVRGSAAARTVTVELAALTAVALLAHPLLAFAAFFAFWHSLRHQARLAQLLRGPAGPAGTAHAGRPLREVAVSALPGLPATVGVLGVAAVLATTGASVLGALLAVIWALTVPHAAAVAVLEVRSHRARADGTGSALAASKPHDPLPDRRAPRAAAGPPAPRAQRVRRG